MIGFGIKEDTTTTGTGSLTLSNVSGYPSFNAVFGTSRRFLYSILDSNGAPLEHGIGYLSGASTMVRAKVLATFASGTYDNTAPAAVSLSSGTKQVIGTVGPGQHFFAAPDVDAGSSTNAPTRAIATAFLPQTSLNSAGFTLQANQIFAYPFFLSAGIEATGMRVRVGTGVASAEVRMGIYDLGHTGYPTNLLAETGALSAATSGSNVSGSFSGGNIFLPPGWYAVAIVSGHAPAIGTAQGTFTNFLGMDSSNNVAACVRRDASHTFGALPNPFPTASNLGSGVSITLHPVISLNAA